MVLALEVLRHHQLDSSSGGARRSRLDHGHRRIALPLAAWSGHQPSSPAWWCSHLPGRALGVGRAVGRPGAGDRRLPFVRRVPARLPRSGL
jgi:hypothetical protein